MRPPKSRGLPPSVVAQPTSAAPAARDSNAAVRSRNAPRVRALIIGAQSTRNGLGPGRRFTARGGLRGSPPPPPKSTTEAARTGVKSGVSRAGDPEGDRSTLTGRQAMRRNVVLLRTNLYGYYDR